MTGMTIGEIGLGSIGTQMVKRLLSAGHVVTVYPRGAGLEEVRAQGAELCADYIELARKSDILIPCLYNDDQVRNVVFGSGALAALRPGSCLIIHTTGSPELAREIGAKAPEGVDVLDACFSGGPADVASGILTLLVGGDAEAFERVLPALETYGKKIHHVGPLGHGQMLKLLNNLLFATNLMNAAELLHLAEERGFETRKAAEVLQGCSGASYAMNLFRAGSPASSAMEGARRFLEKDVATVRATAPEEGFDLTHFTGTVDYFTPRQR